MQQATITANATTLRQAGPAAGTAPRRLHESRRDPPDARLDARSPAEPAWPDNQVTRLAPPRAELVEELDSGRLYLRAFKDGHYYWQPVDARLDGIPDAGTWHSDAELHAAYWLNHGSYRRRAGRYYAIEEAHSLAKAA